MINIRNRRETLDKMNEYLAKEAVTSADYLAAELLTMAYSLATKAKEAEDMFFSFAETFAQYIGIIPVPDPDNPEDEVTD